MLWKEIESFAWQRPDILDLRSILRRITPVNYVYCSISDAFEPRTYYSWPRAELAVREKVKDRRRHWQSSQI